MQRNKHPQLPQPKERKLINKNEFIKLAKQVKEIFERERDFLAKEAKKNENPFGGEFFSLS